MDLFECGEKSRIGAFLCQIVHAEFERKFSKNLSSRLKRKINFEKLFCGGKNSGVKLIFMSFDTFQR